MTAGFNFNNYAAGFCSATPALRGNEVSMDTIDLGNSESIPAVFQCPVQKCDSRNAAQANAPGG
ncbi:hypothetical protein AE53_04099 [Escherichia coli BIDMC 78]|nr:hypothetical protein AE53_04099 [Escherichia coli BIDMC 78]